MTGAAMTDQVIFDLGMNNGDDTNFYLRKGFTVVAVEANPELCARAGERFATEIADGRLRVLNRAVAAKAGHVQLFINETVSGWSTANTEWLESRVRLETKARPVTVPAVTLQEVIGEFGVPYYLKADIQGAEIACLEALVGMNARPAYVSVSAGTDVLTRGATQHIRRQMSLLSRLGYDRFQIVSQADTELQKCPYPALEGVYLDYAFKHGCSGLFGRELPGQWIDAAAALREHQRIVRSYKLAGHSRSPAGWFRRLPGERVRYALDRIFPRGLGWYDTHATQGDKANPRPDLQRATAGSASP
jgi:FkbM family methyltransferase